MEGRGLVGFTNVGDMNGFCGVVGVTEKGGGE